MSIDAALIAHLMDVLRPLGGVSARRMFGGVSARRMFGGAGLFRDGAMFALISDETLYLKADATTIPAFEAEGCGPFVYDTKKGERTIGSYWRAPEFLLDDDEAMLAWCRRAAELAVRTAKTTAKRGVTRSPAAGRSRRSPSRRNG